MVTRGNRRLKGVLWEYKRLHRVTRGYRGFQEGYPELQGLTRGDKGVR